MSATLSKLRTSWVGRALLAYAVSALALVVLGLAAPGSAVFFPLVSLWCNLALFGLVLVVLRLADVKFDLFHWAVIIGFWAAALLYFYWAETRRSFVYIWDYVNYINKQYNAEAAFLQSPGAGFRYIFDSFTEDYTNFTPRERTAAMCCACVILRATNRNSSIKTPPPPQCMARRRMGCDSPPREASLAHSSNPSCIFWPQHV